MGDPRETYEYVARARAWAARWKRLARRYRDDAAWAGGVNRALLDGTGGAACAEERADGKGGCGACAWCCAQATAERDALAARVRDLERAGASVPSCADCGVDLTPAEACAGIGACPGCSAVALAKAGRTVVAALPRCVYCPNPGTHMWPGDLQLGVFCDEHAGEMMDELPYAAAVRLLTRAPTP